MDSFNSRQAYNKNSNSCCKVKNKEINSACFDESHQNSSLKNSTKLEHENHHQRQHHLSQDNSMASSSSSSSPASSESHFLPNHVRVIVVTDMNGKERKLYIPASLDLDRPKRPRTIFTSQQLQILDLEFQQNPFITETKRQALSLILNLSETQIKVWFQNRRTKFRREKKNGVVSPSSPTTTCTSTVFTTTSNKNDANKCNLQSFTSTYNNTSCSFLGF